MRGKEVAAAQRRSAGESGAPKISAQMHGLTALSKIEESILDERQSEGEADDDEEAQLMEGDVVVEEFPDVTCSDGFDVGTTSSVK